jgi:hypothetical protein
MAPPKPALIAGGISVLVLLVVVVWGYFFSKPKFWGLFSKEGDECTPDEDDEIANADKYQLDKDKKCILVKSCGSGYSPNSSNTACTSSVPSGPSGSSGSSDPSGPPPPPPPPPGASETIDVPFANKGIPDPIPTWMSQRMEDPYALQYAKIGDKWGASKCTGGNVPFTPLDTTADPRRKYCVGVNDDTLCKTKVDYAMKMAPGAFGDCGASECRSTHVPYDGKCAVKTPDNARLLTNLNGGHYNEEIGGQPGFVMIPADELQPDYNCTEMCTNKGFGRKSRKSFKSMLPSKWKGSYIYSTQPTARFWNYSSNEIATNPDLWDQVTLDAFIEFINSGVPTQGDGNIINDIKTGNGGFENGIYASKIMLGLKPGGRQDEPFSESDINEWKDFLLTKLSCYCQGTSKSDYAW